MKFVATADLHLKMYSQDKIIPESGLPERLHFLNETIRYDILKYCIDNKIDTIVIAGDVYDTKSIIHSIAQSVLIDIIRDHRQIHFIITDGNHDMSLKSGEGISALKSLDKECNVEMLHKPKVIENILFAPWNAKTMVDTIKNGTAEYLVSHLGLNEAELSSGISIVSDIGIQDLSQYRTCILGHYHNPQEIIRENINLYYTGSPIQINFGERGENKRFLVVDTKTHDISSIPTNRYKQYYALELTNENSKEVIKEALELREQGHFVRLDKLENVDTSEIDDKIRVIDKQDIDITDRGINTTMSDEDKLREYVKIKDVAKEDIEFYINIGKELISECS